MSKDNLQGPKIGYFSPSYMRADHPGLTQKVYPFVKMVVHEFEAEKYREKGWEIIVIPDSYRGNIARVRNWIVDTFLPEFDCVVMLDDDVSFVGRWEKQENKKFTPDELEEFCEVHAIMCQDWGFLLWGVNPQPTDKGAYREYTPYASLSYLSGTFHAHMRGTNCRYDESLPLKEDFDLTLQHMYRNGGCMRVNFAFFEAKQSEQPGGCAAYRNLDIEKKQFLLLQKKWGSDVVTMDTKSKKSYDYNPVIKVPLKGV